MTPRLLVLLAVLAPFLPPLGAQDEPALGGLVAANTEFACDLHRALGAGEPGNLFASPYSVSSALLMTYAGARSGTATAMARTLHVDALGDGVHALAAELFDQLASRAGAGADRGEPFQLEVANALWGQSGLEFLPSFLDRLEDDHAAGIRTVDFRADPERARGEINAAVREATRGRIADLLQPRDVTEDTSLVLTNAIWFKASWSEAFPADRTAPGTFRRADGTTVEAPFLATTRTFAYGAGDGVQAVELPYVGEEVAMLVLLPDEGGLAGLEEGLTAERLGAIVAGLGRARVDLALPRFECRSRASLRGALSELGMAEAFTDGADFSGMTGRPDLRIGEVIHQSFVTVDEKGTEAAAATAVLMGPTGMAPRTVTMKVDRPFLFLIRDRKTGAVLFLGRIADPS